MRLYWLLLFLGLAWSEVADDKSVQIMDRFNILKSVLPLDSTHLRELQEMIEDSENIDVPPTETLDQEAFSELNDRILGLIELMEENERRKEGYEQKNEDGKDGKDGAEDDKDGADGAERAGAEYVDGDMNFEEFDHIDSLDQLTSVDPDTFDDGTQLNDRSSEPVTIPQTSDLVEEAKRVFQNLRQDSLSDSVDLRGLKENEEVEVSKIENEENEVSMNMNEISRVSEVKDSNIDLKDSNNDDGLKVEDPTLDESPKDVVHASSFSDPYQSSPQRPSAQDYDSLRGKAKSNRGVQKVSRLMNDAPSREISVNPQFQFHSQHSEHTAPVPYSRPKTHWLNEPEMNVMEGPRTTDVDSDPIDESSSPSLSNEEQLRYLKQIYQEIQKLIYPIESNEQVSPSDTETPEPRYIISEEPRYTISEETPEPTYTISEETPEPTYITPSEESTSDPYTTPKSTSDPYTTPKSTSDPSYTTPKEYTEGTSKESPRHTTSVPGFSAKPKTGTSGTSRPTGFHQRSKQPKKPERQFSWSKLFTHQEPKKHRRKHGEYTSSAAGRSVSWMAVVCMCALMVYVIA